MKLVKNKVCLIMLFVVTLCSTLYSYRVQRNLQYQMDEVIFKHDHTPSKSIMAIRSLEARIEKLESRRRP